MKREWVVMRKGCEYLTHPRSINHVGWVVEFWGYEPHKAKRFTFLEALYQAARHLAFPAIVE